MKSTRTIRTYLMASILIGMFLTSCEKKSNDTPAINEWIETYMDYAYFWNQEMPDIDPRRESDSEKYFSKLLKKPEDRWSFITDNAKELFKSFDGIIKSMGYSIQLYYHDNTTSNQVIAIVEYVYPNSPASEAGVKRGDVFTRINGTTITDQNYQALLSQDEITITLATRTANSLVEQDNTLDLSSRELNTNPIIVKSVLELDGIKIGYLAYTSFIEKFNPLLIEAFAEFKSAGINELVLDLRYNGGGSVSSAQLMAGLIAPTAAAEEVFITEVWNSNLKSYNEQLKIKKHPENLNLNRVYILTTKGTASASEMVIYGLKPHMNVVQIGDSTYGKYYGSITITADKEMNHNWAMQPIVMRAENKTNDIDYKTGLPPNHKMIDNQYNAALGDPTEFFLAAAISLITKGSLPVAPTLKSKTIQNIVPSFKEWENPHRNTMRIKREIR